MWSSFPSSFSPNAHVVKHFWSWLSKLHSSAWECCYRHVSALGSVTIADKKMFLNISFGTHHIFTFMGSQPAIQNMKWSGMHISSYPPSNFSLEVLLNLELSVKLEKKIMWLCSLWCLPSHSFCLFYTSVACPTSVHTSFFSGDQGLLVVYSFFGFLRSGKSNLCSINSKLAGSDTRNILVALNKSFFRHFSLVFQTIIVLFFGEKLCLLYFCGLLC